MNMRSLFLASLLAPLTAFTQIEQVKEFGTFGTEPFPRALKASGDLVFFAAFDPGTGWEMWRSDGTAAGTFMVKDINPGSGDGVALEPWAADLDGTLMFAANDGSHGIELWKSDGTEAGTVMVKDINMNGDSYPSFFIAQGGFVLFSAVDENGSALWRSAGDASNTGIVFADFSPVGSLPILMQDVAYYNAYNNDAGGYALFKASASLDFAEAVFPPSAGGPNGCYGLIAADTLVYFIASSGDSGTEPWGTDGYPWATIPIDVRPGDVSSYPSTLLAINDVLYLGANDGTNGPGLYRRRPGYAVEFLSSVRPMYATGQLPHYMTSLNGDPIYFGSDPATGVELFRYDVLNDTVNLVMDINPGVLDGVNGTSDIVVYNGRLYFLGHANGTGNELWTSDGTAAGTHIVQDMNVGGSDFDPIEVTRVGSTLFMRGTVNASPNQLFKLDLSEANATPEARMERTLSAWPNPAHGSVHLSGIHAGDQVRVFASDGRLLKVNAERQLEGVIELDLRDLAPGVYVVDVRDTAGIHRCVRLVVR